MLAKKWFLPLCFFLSAALGIPRPASSDAGALLLRSVRVIDGTGTPASEPQDIEIIGGRIARIGARLQSKASRVIDGSGKTVMPGLIDTHTHIGSVPGSVFRKDSPEEIRVHQRAQRKAYLAAGVTTVLDAAAPESLLREAAQEAGDAPRILGLAPFLTPVGGYFASDEARGGVYADLWKPVDGPQTVVENFRKAVPLRPLGAKVTIENGFGPIAVWPTFDEGLRRTIVEEGKKSGLPLFIHSMSKQEHRIALSMEPYALVHGNFGDEVADAEIIAEIKRSKAFVSTTLAIYKLMLLMWEPQTLDDPWIRRLVPAAQLATAKNPEVTAQVVDAIALQSKPWWIPSFVAGWLSKSLMNRSVVETQLSNSMKSSKLMHDAGIPLVMGSDAGNWPVWSTFFHGVGTILEIEALCDAGIPPAEVIVASTSRAAQMLKLDKEVGRIAPGFLADLVVLNEDPLVKKTAFRNVAYVIKGGIAKDPASWME